MAEHFENLQKALCKELEKLDKKYTAEAEMTEQDVERADILYHALKSAATYHAMKDAEEWGESEESEYSGANGGRSSRRSGRSYARRSPRTGRFMSREMAYADGGYSGGYSGGYPMEYIDPMWDRRY